MKKLLTITALLLHGLSYAQTDDTLSLSYFLDNVREAHPLMMKANIYSEVGDAYRTKGRGALDPKVTSQLDEKHFDGKDYFRLWNSEAKLPTRLPVDFSVGYEQNEGLYLNEQNNLPANGLIYGTVNVSLIRGFLFDEQRENIRQGKLSEVKSDIQRLQLEREVLSQATGVYLQWATAYYTLEAYRSYQDLVTIRHKNVIELFNNGDKPAIDTVESRLNLNSAQKLMLDARQEIIKSKQKVDLFLWSTDGEPLQLKEEIVPENLSDLLDYIQELSAIENLNLEKDPSIQKLQNEIDVLTIENRLQREYLKPQLDVKYNTIVSMGDTDVDPTLQLNNYKYGVSFEMPLLNRKTRGQIKLNNAIIEQTHFDKSIYRETIRNKYNANIEQINIQNQALEVIREKLDNSQTIYEAELLKFDIGESSIFLLNQRERKILETQIDRLENLYKLGQLYNDIYYLKLGQV